MFGMRYLLFFTIVFFVFIACKKNQSTYGYRYLEYGKACVIPENAFIFNNQKDTISSIITHISNSSGGDIEFQCTNSNNSFYVSITVPYPITKSAIYEPVKDYTSSSQTMNVYIQSSTITGGYDYVQSGYGFITLNPNGTYDVSVCSGRTVSNGDSFEVHIKTN